MDYRAALELLAGALKFGIQPSLDGIRMLTDALGRPQDAYASVQVTGTNGKSSVTRLTAALLAAEGLSTGAYTSPHLESYTERIEFEGRAVGEADFAAAIDAAAGAASSVGAGRSFTEFELLTAAALWLMRERGVDVACLEVGMGGRWDATSVVEPAVAVITGVGIDHAERLGSTVEAIATDKSQIIGPSTSVVLGPGTRETAAIFLERAALFDLHPRFVTPLDQDTLVPEALTVRFDVHRVPSAPGGDLVLDVCGAHERYEAVRLAAPSYQAPNVATAIAAAESALGRGLRPERVREALGIMRFPGRFELVARDPDVVLDGAHNPQAAGVLATAVAEAWPSASARPIAVLGMLSDKDAAGIVRELAPVVGRFVVTQPDSSRALPGEQLAEVVAAEASAVPLTRAASLADALAVALEAARDASRGVLVTGSLYTVGQARGLLRKRRF